MHHQSAHAARLAFNPYCNTVDITPPDGGPWEAATIIYIALPRTHVPNTRSNVLSNFKNDYMLRNDIMSL
jgi:hypothetical protein